MNTPSLSYESPAKLNLFLHILGRRPDGYHQLQTVFQLVSLCDTLEFSAPQGTPPGLLALRCDDPAIPLERNLVLEAARKLRTRCQRPTASASIHLVKRIPMGAGLGGGSSNAAITLLALNQLWNTGLSAEQLCEIGIQLGADVPLFIKGQSAWATGVGEVLEPIELPPRYYLILWPGVAVSTAEIFSHQQLTRDSSAIKIADFLSGKGQNDCEQLVRKLFPAVDEALIWLSQFGPARLTGTGSCVFVSFEDESKARAALVRVPARFKGFVARGLKQLPTPVQA